MWVCPPSWKPWGPYYSLSISQKKKWRDHGASISCMTRCHEVNICLSLPGSSTAFAKSSPHHQPVTGNGADMVAKKGTLLFPVPKGNRD